MGGYTIQASRVDTNVGLSLSVSPTTPAASSAVVAIRDENEPQAPLPLYLDFADSTFKTGGWAVRQALLTSLGSNFFALNGGLDISIITNLPVTTMSLAAEFEATVSGQTLSAIDHIELSQDGTFASVGWARLNAANIEVTITGKRRGADFPILAATISYFNSDGTNRFGILGPAGPDVNGVVLLSTPGTLIAQASYWEATVTDVLGTYVTRGNVPFTN